MKQIILILLFCCFSSISVSAQNAKTADQITDKQWQDLFSALGNEDWNTAFGLSDKYLKLLKDNDEANSIANLRYMYLFSAAGRVSERKMSYDELEQIVKSFVGKKIVSPFRTIAAKCEGREFNFICPSDNAKNKIVTVATNKAATSIYAFEYTQLKEDFDFDKYKGKFAAVSGVVKSIVPNPNKSTLVILRIYISDGYVILKEQMEKKTSK
jgi:hypothetical protein